MTLTVIVSGTRAADRVAKEMESCGIAVERSRYTGDLNCCPHILKSQATMEVFSEIKARLPKYARYAIQSVKVA